MEAKPAHDAKPADDAEDLKRAEFERISKQYRKMEKDGETFYCRNEKRLGTRLGAPVCLTVAQLWERIRKAEEVRTEMRSAKPGPCQPPMTCN